MSTVRVEEIGGIRSADRGVPGLLIIFAVAVLSVALWYLLSFSSTDYHGSYPKPDVPAVSEPAGGGGGH
ncbi:MAG TPA: hypothetical protein VM841_04190 [Actinomycetota bacterium]|nr:hypothetical protein [Actinomycetota bacterium]